MKRVIILTGDELRHRYFRTKLSNDGRFVVIKAFCEGTERGLEARVRESPQSSWLERAHVIARKQSEEDFFGEVLSALGDKSNPIKLKKGEINQPNVVDKIVGLKPDLLICYGSSLIRTSLLDVFHGRFLNVHLGLSPYYRGSGTNVWPLINNEPYMVGATFMYIDAGIDTGKIIHQIRADFFLGDSAHTVGNRLIRKMTAIYSDIIARFEHLYEEPQPTVEGVLYRSRDFDSAACARLYRNFSEGMIEKFIESTKESNWPYIVQNRALSQTSGDTG